jgi:hypothetical protein
MNVIYHEKAKEWREGYPLMEEATERLEEIVARAVDPVEVEWDSEEDKQGRRVYTLKLRDFAGEVKDSFTREELMRVNERHGRVYRLIGELLRIRDHRLGDQLREGNGEED